VLEILSKVAAPEEIQISTIDPTPVTNGVDFGRHFLLYLNC